MPDSLTARDPAGPGTADQATAIVALESLRASVAARPDDAGLRAELARHLAAAGLGTEAVTQYREVLRIQPGNLAAANDLTDLFATHPDEAVRDGAAAVELAEDLAIRTVHANPVILDTLAAAYAETGRFGEAVLMAQRARQAATRAGNHDLARVIIDRLYWYRHDLPYREAPGGTDRASKPAP